MQGNWVGASCQFHSPVEAKTFFRQRVPRAWPSCPTVGWVTPYLGPNTGHAPRRCHSLHGASQAGVPWAET